MTDIKAIVEGLSEGQRRLLLMIRDYRSAFDLGLASHRQCEILRRKHLLSRDGNEHSIYAPITDYFYKPTAKGRYVQDYLKGQDQ